MTAPLPSRQRATDAAAITERVAALDWEAIATASALAAQACATARTAFGRPMRLAISE